MKTEKKKKQSYHTYLDHLHYQNLIKLENSSCPNEIRDEASPTKFHNNCCNDHGRPFSNHRHTFLQQILSETHPSVVLVSTGNRKTYGRNLHGD